MASKAGDLVGQILKGAGPQLRKFWYYARVELTPPTLKDVPEIKNRIVKIMQGYKSGAWKQITVRDAWLNLLVATEVGCWFYIGECIGKRHLIGYKLE